MSAEGGSARRRPGAVDLGLVLLGLALIGLTIVVVIVPVVPPAVVNDRFDVTILTAAMLIAGAVAALDWARARVTHDPAALFRSSAFTVLALLNALTLVAGLVGADAALGGTLDDPGQLPLIARVVGRGIASALLVTAGVAALSRVMPAFSSRAVLIGPAALVLVLILAAARWRDALPNLVPNAVIDALASDPTASLALGAAPALVVIQSIIGVGFLVAALLAHRSFRRSGRLADALLAAGLLVAAFSQVHSAIHPGSYSGVVTIADLLRLAFYGLLLVGVVAESRQDLADLRAATVEVRRLAAAEFAAAGLEERARLAREIHDGLAQDLWYAKLKQSRLAQLVGFQDEAQRLNEEVEGAIDAALAEARHAIAAMREGADAGPLLDMLARQADDFSDRFALRAELISDGPMPELGPRAQAETLRIVQEAMTNARRHADATVVQIRVAREGDRLRVSISDNGRGFKPADVARGFGLDSMRQRAIVIGGELSVMSAPQNGTIVELLLPIRRGEATGG
ncbi:MAG: ATP-binding protein [Candidatus Limnocylindria bacterium]